MRSKVVGPDCLAGKKRGKVEKKLGRKGREVKPRKRRRVLRRRRLLTRERRPGTRARLGGIRRLGLHLLPRRKSLTMIMILRMTRRWNRWT